MSDTGKQTLTDGLCAARELTTQAAERYREASRSCRASVAARVYEWLAGVKDEHLARIDTVHARLAKGEAEAAACALPDQELAEIETALSG